MFVRWNETGTKMIQLTRTMRDTRVVDTPKGPAEVGMTIDPEKADIKVRREFVLLGPGINEISEDEFELAKPNIQLDLKKKKIQVLKVAVSSRKPKADEIAQRISDLSVDAAIVMIGNVGPKVAKTIVPNFGNRDTLYRWLAEDDRSNVNDAIYARLRFLGFLSEEDANSKKPDPQDMAKARALVAEADTSEATEEDYVDESELVEA